MDRINCQVTPRNCNYNHNINDAYFMRGFGIDHVGGRLRSSFEIGGIPNFKIGNGYQGMVLAAQFSEITYTKEGSQRQTGVFGPVIGPSWAYSPGNTMLFSGQVLSRLSISTQDDQGDAELVLRGVVTTLSEVGYSIAADLAVGYRGSFTPSAAFRLDF